MRCLGLAESVGDAAFVRYLRARSLDDLGSLKTFVAAARPALLEVRNRDATAVPDFGRARGCECSATSSSFLSRRRPPSPMSFFHHSFNFLPGSSQ